MMNIITYEAITEEYGWGKYGDFKVLIRKKDGYVNATKLCRDGGKELSNWSRLSCVQKLMFEFERELQKDKSALLVLRQDGRNRLLSGTYIHQDLVPHIASWISPKFAVFVSKIIREWRATSPDKELLFWNTMGDCVVNHPYSSEQEEKKWQQLIAARENGQMEVETRFGLIDVLTASKVIEVKRAAQWKHAIGQVLCYQAEYPTKSPAIYLFDWEAAQTHVIDESCARFGIEVHYLKNDLTSAAES